MIHLPQASDGRSGDLMRQKAAQLLGAGFINPFVFPEEQSHPWSVNESQKIDCPLMRLWDMKSGSQPSEDDRMLSRSPNQPLDTAKVRMESLATHLDHSIWEPTPYISFTKSASAIEDLAARRSMKRGNQTLTVINPAARLRVALPVLDVATEMDHYRIPDPYNKGMRYYIDHYVCLWEVTGVEIIRHYEWEELFNTANWYQEVILPAWNKSNRDLEILHASTFDMSTIMENPPGKS
jgi:hypothetical protein